MKNIYIESVLRAIENAYLMHSDSRRSHPEYGIKEFASNFGNFLHWNLSKSTHENNSERWFRKNMNILLKDLWLDCHQENFNDEIQAILRTIVEDIDYCGSNFDNSILGSEYGLYHTIINDKSTIMEFIDSF